jgi:hypothetical protein
MSERTALTLELEDAGHAILVEDFRHRRAGLPNRDRRASSGPGRSCRTPCWITSRVLRPSASIFTRPMSSAARMSIVSVPSLVSDPKCVTSFLRDHNARRMNAVMARVPSISCRRADAGNFSRACSDRRSASCLPAPCRRCGSAGEMTTPCPTPSVYLPNSRAMYFIWDASRLCCVVDCGLPAKLRYSAKTRNTLGTVLLPSDR